MDKLIIILLLFLIISIVNFLNNYNSKKKQKKRDDYIKSLASFTIASATFEVAGIHWRESVPVDIQDNELSANDPFLYGRRSFGFISTKFHKQKEVSKFNTKIQVSIPYQNKRYIFKDTLAIDETSLRLGLYNNENITVYVEKLKNKGLEEVKFYFDFSFLTNNTITIISTNYYRT